MGDVSSPLNWDAAFATLMVALSKVDGGSLSRGIGMVKAAFRELQATADILSAFCIKFGLDLADVKFRAFVSIFGTGVQHVKWRLRIHKHGWVEHEVELQLDGSFKQLGVVLDMSGHHVTQLNLAKSKLSECVRRVKPRMASSESKWRSL